MLFRSAAALAARRGENVPAAVADRVAAEQQQIFSNHYADILCAAARLAEYSNQRGYPVGFRGLAGNLYLAYLLGIAALDPMALGLRWEACLGLSGGRTPEITLNVAPALLDSMAALLGEALPERASAVRLCPHQLKALAGDARQRSGKAPRQEDIFSAELVTRAYQEDVSGIPVLGDLDGFQDLAKALKPSTFLDLTRIMGLCLAPEIRFQAERLSGQSDPFEYLTGTREDIYDILIRRCIGADDAFRIMQQLRRGGSSKLATREYRDAITGNPEFPGVFLDVLDSMAYLYPRGQCADYLYHALTLLWCKECA